MNGIKEKMQLFDNLMLEQCLSKAILVNIFNSCLPDLDRRGVI